MLNAKVVVGICFLFFSMSFGQTTTPAKYGQLSIKNSHFYSASLGVNIQLKGMSMYPWTSAGGYDFYNRACINQLVQTWHCTAIRLPYMSPITMAMIDTVIQACIDNGIYVIVDWHGDSPSASTTGPWFAAIAKQYGSYPNIMYEPWNEPNGSSATWANIKTYMESVIAAIRAVDTKNIVICGNPQWDQEPQLAAADPITDYQNIAYSMHFYAASHPRASFGPGITTAMKDGCAIFITEYGTCDASGGSPVNTAATQTWYNFLDSNQIGSANWGVEWVDGGGAACFNTNVSYTGPWAPSDLTADGTFVQAYIMKEYAVGVLPYGSNFQPENQKHTYADLFPGADTKSTSILYSTNGTRIIGAPASRLANGLYFIMPEGNLKAQRMVNVNR